jgi:hypothetical protein
MMLIMVRRVIIPLAVLIWLTACPKPERQAADSPLQAASGSKAGVAANSPAAGPAQWEQKYTLPKAGSVTAYG